MPHLVIAVLVAGGVGNYAGYRMLKGKKRPQMRTAEQKTASGADDRGALVWDEASGTYKPRG